MRELSRVTRNGTALTFQLTFIVTPDAAQSCCADVASTPETVEELDAELFEVRETMRPRGMALEMRALKRESDLEGRVQSCCTEGRRPG